MKDRMNHLVTLAAAMASGTKSDALNYKQIAEKSWKLLLELENVYVNQGENVEEGPTGVRDFDEDD